MPRQSQCGTKTIYRTGLALDLQQRHVGWQDFSANHAGPTVPNDRPQPMRMPDKSCTVRFAGLLAASRYNPRAESTSETSYGLYRFSRGTAFLAVIESGDAFLFAMPFFADGPSTGRGEFAPGMPDDKS
jgi:hypothetical protein